MEDELEEWGLIQYPDYAFFQTSNFIKKSRIFIFDVDGTLIVTKNGTPPFLIKDPNNYIFFDTVFEKLRKIQEKFSIILISNQQKYNDIVEGKFEEICINLEDENIEFQLYILKTKAYAKPSTLIIKEIKKNWDPLKISRINVCGDAASEITDFPPFKWSNSDYEFFKNLDISKKRFYLPTDIFGFKEITDFKIKKKELILLLGNQGSGKSTVAKYFQENGYKVVSGDDGLSLIKQIKMVEKLIEMSKSIIIDNTNGSREKRMKFIRIAKNKGYKTRIIWCIRDGSSFNELRENPIPKVAYSVYAKYFEEPEDEVDLIEQYY